MNCARTFWIAYALGRGSEPRDALRFARYSSLVKRDHYLTADELFEDWSNLAHVARVEFALYETNMAGLAS